MLLCGIDQVEAGAVVAVPLQHPRRPDVELLAAGVPIEDRMISRLQRLGVTHLWIRHDLTADLELAVSPTLTTRQLAVFERLRHDFTALAQRTISQGDIHTYRQAMMELVCEVVSNHRLAGLAQRLQSHRGPLMAHSVNVAYLALLIGLELETYIVHERPKVASEHARDLTNLALGGLLHDVGKTRLDTELANLHEACEGEYGLDAIEEETADAYRGHCELGYRMLGTTRIPASARGVVLGHHQRFDGGGWPDMAEVTDKRRPGPQAGHEIHIFSRIVAVANVLDNLLRAAEQRRQPAIAALYAFSACRFDGWFDPLVRQMAMRCLPPFPLGAHVTLSDGSEAAVVCPSLHQPCRPTVRLLRTDDDGQTPQIDLHDHYDLRIVRCAGQDVTEYLFELNPELPRQPSRAA